MQVGQHSAIKQPIVTLMSAGYFFNKKIFQKMEQDVAKVKVDSVGTMIVRVVVDTICERKI